jgi:hypothetical protein
MATKISTEVEAVTHEISTDHLLVKTKVECSFDHQVQPRPIKEQKLMKLNAEQRKMLIESDLFGTIPFIKLAAIKGWTKSVTVPFGDCVRLTKLKK